MSGCHPGKGEEGGVKQTTTPTVTDDAEEDEKSAAPAGPFHLRTYLAVGAAAFVRVALAHGERSVGGRCALPREDENGGRCSV